MWKSFECIVAYLTTHSELNVRTNTATTVAVIRYKNINHTNSFDGRLTISTGYVSNEAAKNPTGLLWYVIQ